ncbi:MAG: hypothetical protein PHV02_10510 [Rhodocyclaceae bacterium]|nr:hypothetical protein [Rhodocyclaceae bacterium]
MATKPKQITPKQPEPRKHVPCHCDDPTDADAAGRAFAGVIVSPELAAYRVIHEANPKNLQDGIDTPGMLAVLRQQADTVKTGDLSQAEAMLINQATALQSLFTRLTERGLSQSHIPNIESFMRLALRAQNQCRSTLETLATIKNPPVIYAKQANISNGPQQVNNGTASPARETVIEQSKQSGDSNELLTDTRTSQAASRVNQTLEAVGEIHRAEIG